MGLREVIAELDTTVRGTDQVASANAAVDRYVETLGPAATQVEQFRLRQAEAAEMASRLGQRLRALQASGSATTEQVQELRLAQFRANQSAQQWGEAAQRASQQTGGLRGAMESLRSAAAPIGTVLGVITAAAYAGIRATRAYVEELERVVELGDDIDKASQRLQISARELQEWRFVAERAGVGAEDVERSFSAVARAAEQARQGTSPAARAFRTLGVQVRDSSGNLRSQADLLGDVLTGLGGVEDTTRRAAIAQQFFGESGARLLTIVRAGPAEVDRLRRRFDELGGGLSDEVVAGAAATQDALGDLDLAWTGLRGTLASAVLPVLTRVIDGLANLVGTLSRWAQTSSLAQAAAVVIGASFLPLIVTVGLLAAALLGVILVVEDVWTAFRGGDSVTGTLIDGFLEAIGVGVTWRDLLRELGEAWDGLVARIRSGASGLLSGLSQVRDVLASGPGGSVAGVARAIAPVAAVGQGRAAGAALNSLSAPITMIINGATDPEAVSRSAGRELVQRIRSAADTLPLAPEAAGG